MEIAFTPTTAVRYLCLGLLCGAFIWHFLRTTLEYLSYPVVVHVSLQDPKYTPIPYVSVCFNLREYISLETVLQYLPVWEGEKLENEYMEAELACFRTSTFYEIANRRKSCLHEKECYQLLQELSKYVLRNDELGKAIYWWIYQERKE